MKPALDLNKIAWKRTFGEVTAMGCWFGQDDTPCLVLVPTFLMGVTQITPCIVPIQNAWHWAEETGEPAYAVQNSLVFAKALGLNASEPRDVLKITSIVRDCLGDLLTMTPRPKTDHVVVADAIVTNKDTGKQRHSEITENV